MRVVTTVLLSMVLLLVVSLNYRAPVATIDPRLPGGTTSFAHPSPRQQQIADAEQPVLVPRHTLAAPFRGGKGRIEHPAGVMREAGGDTDDDDDDGEVQHPRMTPAPPPTTLPPGVAPPPKEWPPGDANAGFHDDPSLPRIAIISLNAQPKGSKGGIGLQGKSSWMHRLSYTNKKAYCKKWGYDLIIEDNDIIDRSRDVAWSKIPIFKKWLPKYQWLMWVDMDAFFMRFDLPATDLISPEHDLILARDWNGLNFGVFLMHNCPWSHALLDRMWNAPRDWWKPWEEQSALMALTDRKKNGREADRLMQHIYIPRQREMNSYGAEFAYGNLQALYRTGDRVIHFPNCKGFRTCRTTIEKFYRTMLHDNEVDDIADADVPASVFPEARNNLAAE